MQVNRDMHTVSAQAHAEVKVLLTNIDTIMAADTLHVAKLHIRHLIQRDIAN
jgi:hypothetical protein